MHHSDEFSKSDAGALDEQRNIDAVVARGPGGAFAVAGVATFLVVAMFFLFYFVVYLPRGAVQ
jgi:hypothetical protein